MGEAEQESELETIAGLLCIVDYKGRDRLISCRSFSIKGGIGYVAAICMESRHFKSYRTDRIDAVFDPQTGEALGDGSYFLRYNPKTPNSSKAQPECGLTGSRRTVLIAGLNILAFMARCDGNWHPLETEPIENFIVSMWLRKEWEGDPPISEIINHAQRLYPDSATVFKALKYYARSTTSTRILFNAISELIAADGVIQEAENHWATQVRGAIMDARLDEFEKAITSEGGAYFRVTIDSFERRVR